MTLSIAFLTAGTGLAASAQRAGVASSNVANANTPGYVRRVVDTTELHAFGTGQGVHASEPRRIDSPALERALRAATSQMAGAELRADRLSAVADALGEPGSTDGIAGAVSAFRDALQRLSVTPDSPELLDAAGGAAVRVAASVREAAGMLAQEKGKALASAQGEMARARDILTALDANNRAILRSAGGGREAPAALMDERGRLLGELAEIMAVTVDERDSGALVVMTREGVTLLDDRVASLRLDAINGVMIDGTVVEPGSGAQALSAGRLASTLEWLRSDVPAIEGEVDALAQEMIDRTAAGGMSGLFFDPAGGATSGLAGRLAVDSRIDPRGVAETWRLRDGLSATAPGVVGDPSQVLALSDALESLIAGPDGVSRSLQESADRLSMQTQSTAGSATEEAARLTGFHDVIAADLDAAEGVNLDAELQSLVEIEKAYAANAMVIETIARMTDVLLSVGR
jgi:flagellar hook-associated protein 1